MGEIESLLKNCSEGVSEDCERLSELILGFAAPTVKKYLNDSQDRSAVADVVQEVGLKAFRKIKANEGPSPFAFASWIRTIARNASIDYLRRARRERELVRRLDVLADFPEQRNEFTSELERMLAVLESVTNSFRNETDQQIWRGVIRGASNDELCRETGLPLGTLKNRKVRVLHVGVSQARARFREEGYDFYE